jgi:hypothetical protein
MYFKVGRTESKKHSAISKSNIAYLLNCYIVGIKKQFSEFHIVLWHTICHTSLYLRSIAHSVSVPYIKLIVRTLSQFSLLLTWFLYLVCHDWLICHIFSLELGLISSLWTCWVFINNFLNVRSKCIWNVSAPIF